MKKNKFNAKLRLNKESIANLNSIEMNNIKGGRVNTINCAVKTFNCVTLFPDYCSSRVNCTFYGCE